MTLTNIVYDLDGGRYRSSSFGGASWEIENIVRQGGEIVKVEEFNQDYSEEMDGLIERVWED